MRKGVKPDFVGFGVLFGGNKPKRMSATWGFHALNSLVIVVIILNYLPVCSPDIFLDFYVVYTK